MRPGKQITPFFRKICNMYICIWVFSVSTQCVNYWAIISREGTCGCLVSIWPQNVIAGRTLWYTSTVAISIRNWQFLHTLFSQSLHTALLVRLIVPGQSLENRRWWKIPKCWKSVKNMTSHLRRSASDSKYKGVFLSYPRVWHLLAFKATLM